MEEDKLPIADASLFEMEEEIGEESKEDPMEKFRREIRTMLYAFGDVKNPHEATLDLIYSIVVEYITNVAKIGQSLEPRNKLTLQAIHYMTQHDIRKFDRIRELLTMNEEIKKARKDFDTHI
uniref:Transcription initiation factor TFIID subunit 13 n=1 Tax=Panagrolaimus davidi TaxID=227884 RepID=A0A914PQJ3_9BILA